MDDHRTKAVDDVTCPREPMSGSESGDVLSVELLSMNVLGESMSGSVSGETMSASVLEEPLSGSLSGDPMSRSVSAIHDCVRECLAKSVWTR